MTETDIQYRCFYMEEEIATLAQIESSTTKRKNADAKSSPSTKKWKEMVCNSIVVQHWFILRNFNQMPLMDMESLKKLFDKADKEVGIAVKEQPLQIDEKDKVIKCHWCGDHFKGSVELKHINQHVKKAEFHSQKRKDITKKGADIRSFFRT